MCATRTSQSPVTLAINIRVKIAKTPKTWGLKTVVNDASAGHHTRHALGPHFDAPVHPASPQCVVPPGQRTGLFRISFGKSPKQALARCLPLVPSPTGRGAEPSNGEMGASDRIFIARERHVAVNHSPEKFHAKRQCVEHQASARSETRGRRNRASWPFNILALGQHGGVHQLNTRPDTSGFRCRQEERIHRILDIKRDSEAIGRPIPSPASGRPAQ